MGAQSKQLETNETYDSAKCSEPEREANIADNHQHMSRKLYVQTDRWIEGAGPTEQQDRRQTVATRMSVV